MNNVEKDTLMHYGVARRSGRYKWGSGEEPYQHSGDFLSRVDELKKTGLTETEIARTMGLSTSKYRVQKSLAKSERRALEADTARGLREKGYSLEKIAETMGYKNDSSVRALLNQDVEARKNVTRTAADFIKKQIDQKGMIDVGAGVERELGISPERLKQALYMLEMEGYPIYGGGVPQVTNKGKQTNLKVICPPGTEHKEIYNFENVHSLKEYVSHDGGDTFDKYVYPKSIDSNRVKIRYAEDGGKEKDGLIELRRNVDDLSLGDARYSQVRILVDDKKYLKGMAIYSDDMPDGVDIVFNTNKNKDIAKMDVMKNITSDPDNPFGSLIKKGGQSYYIDKDGKRQLSLINKRADEGDWDEWKDNLPSQFLSKQNISLAKKQLGLHIIDKQDEFNELCAYTNPTIKKKLLNSFAEDCDAAAEHLKAAALPRQKYHVFIPVPSLKDNEVYAPNYDTGEQVAVVRFPHGGTFEIPILTVNNKHPVSKKLLGNAEDAIGINSKVAERLSGADFDGDAGIVIPTGGKVKITSTPMLDGLKGFDAKLEYGGKKEGSFKLMNNTQTEMGIVSNLITDMTLKGATQDELAKVVRHSMVVIDAEKHKLDYRQSYKDNDIAYLKKKYQGYTDENGVQKGGASTLISRAKSEIDVLKRKGSPIIDKDTGEISYKEVHEEYVNKNGKVVSRTQKSTQMAETKDAHSLSSGHPMEEVYAEYANKMKAFANQARKEAMVTGKIQYSPSAKKVYQAEVDYLNAHLNIALKNAPRERDAQLRANTIVKAKIKANPDMTSGEIKKASQQAITASRLLVGAKRELITITDRAWEAIQAGAISENMLTKIINNVDSDALKQRAMPRSTNVLSTAKVNRLKHLMTSGYTTDEVARTLGISTSAVNKYLKRKE